MSKNVVSIWMVTYNHEPYIAKAIDSVLMQETSFDFHLFIGEDCSTDCTLNICKDYAEKYPDKITLFANEQNIGATNNGQIIYKACFESGAKYIAMLEGDDYWIDPHKLQKQVDILEKEENIYLVGSNAYILRNNVAELYSDYRDFSGYKVLNSKDLICPVLRLHTSTFVFRNIKISNEWYENTSIFNGDFVILFSCFLKGKIVTIKDYTSTYRDNPAGVSSIQTKYSNSKSYIELFEKFNLISKKKYNLYVNSIIINYYLDILSFLENKGEDKVFIKYFFKLLFNYILYLKFRDFKTLLTILKRKIL